MKYEVKRLYTNSTIYGIWKEDKEISSPATEISEEEAKRIVNFLSELGTKHYETPKAIVYYSQSDARHMTEYWFHKQI